MKLVFFFLFLSFSLGSHSQAVVDRVKSFVSEQKIDSFLVYSQELNGSFISPDSCEREESKYLFWHSNNQWYLKRFDYCKTFDSVLLADLNPLSFYLRNKYHIDKEKIKEPKYYEKIIKNGRKEVLTISITASHQLYHKFQYVIGVNINTLFASEFYLTFERFENGKRNINYPINQNTKLKALIDLTIKATELIVGSGR